MPGAPDPPAKGGAPEPSAGRPVSRAPARFAVPGPPATAAPVPWFAVTRVPGSDRLAVPHSPGRSVPADGLTHGASPSPPSPGATGGPGRQ